jgi:hypothetical protein
VYIQTETEKQYIFCSVPHKLKTLFLFCVSKDKNPFHSNIYDNFLGKNQLSLKNPTVMSTYCTGTDKIQFLGVELRGVCDK